MNFENLDIGLGLLYVAGGLLVLGSAIVVYTNAKYKFDEKGQPIKKKSEE